jgi:hypothetical protein
VILNSNDIKISLCTINLNRAERAKFLISPWLAMFVSSAHEGCHSSSEEEFEKINEKRKSL